MTARVVYAVASLIGRLLNRHHTNFPTLTTRSGYTQRPFSWMATSTTWRDTRTPVHTSHAP